MLARLGQAAAEWQLEARSLFGGRYPKFVWDRAPPALVDDVPVFVFHSIDPAEFERQLAFLADNGYRGLDCDGFLAHLAGTARAPPKSVLLTIDDGRASVWTHGFPLLRKYQFPAVVFLIPGFIRDHGLSSPTLDDLWAGRCSPEQMQSRDPELMSWAEIEAIGQSGLVDFQSHTLYHHRVPIGARIVDYINPRTTRALFDVPIEVGRERELRELGIAGLYGAPIYENDSPMSGEPVYRPDPRLSDACVEHVVRSGGSEFFAGRGWRSELDRVVADWRHRYGGSGHMEDPARQQRERVADLRRARELIEQRLPGTDVRHLCYPYTVGSGPAVEASREAGYRTNFWGILPDRRDNRPGQDPYFCPRLKGDFIFRLPGRGRKPLATILLDKAARRLSGRRVY